MPLLKCTSTSSVSTTTSTSGSTAASWLSARGTKSFFVPSIRRPSNNVAAAAALTMMSGQLRQPLRQINTMANVSILSNSRTSTSSASNSATYDSQETCLLSPAAAQLQDHFDGGKELSGDSFDNDEESLGEVIQDSLNESADTSAPEVVCAPPNVGPPEWGNINPDVILKRCRAIPVITKKAYGVREFYKSYPCWDKMTQDQKNKSLAWFRSLPDGVQGIVIFLFCCCRFHISLSNLFCYFSLF